MKLDLDKNKKYLLACSYGPDSMALFHMLKSQGYHFDAALVNYHLRQESDFEMDSFISYCKNNDVNYHVLNLTSYHCKGNIENECRKIRYQYFYDLSKEYGYDAVLVAHHQDDHIETYFMQKDRKNLVKYYGINKETLINRVRIVRPLLNFSKAELLDYCLKNNIPYAIDKTNLLCDFKRNSIRHLIVEKLSQEERKQMLLEINERNKYLEDMFNRLQNMSLDRCDVLRNLSDQELAYALNFRSNDFGISLSFKQCQEIRRVLESDKPNISIFLKRNIYFEKSYERCYFCRKEEVTYSFVLETPGRIDNEYFYLDFTIDSSNRNVHPDDYPLMIRSANKNDVIKVKDYHVKVNRLFIDWKMPLQLRNRWPIIVNKNGENIYIPRYQKDFIPDKDSNFYVK